MENNNNIKNITNCSYESSKFKHVNILEKYIEKYKEYGKSIETIGLDKVEEYQLFAINSILKYAKENNDYYKSVFNDVKLASDSIDSLKDYTEYPFLYKDTIRGDKNKLQCVDNNKIVQYHLTSGTTGKPLYTSLTLADQYYHDSIPKYEVLYKDYKASDIVGIALPYEFAQPALGFHRMFQFMFNSTVISFGKGGYMAPIEKTIEVINELDVSILITTPSYASMIYEEIARQGLEIGKDINVRKIILTGEGCSPQFISRLKEVWECKFELVYGSTECGLVGLQLDNNPGYYILEGNNYVEIVNPDTGEVVINGECGEVVITTMLRESMPFIRYRTGDLGYIELPDKDDLIQLRKLNIRGRIGGNIEIEGVEFAPLAIEHILMMVSEVSLWYELIIDGESLTINVENISDSSDEQVADNVKSLMFTYLGLPCNVCVSEKIERQYSKAQRVFYK